MALRDLITRIRRDDGLDDVRRDALRRAGWLVDLLVSRADARRASREWRAPEENRDRAARTVAELNGTIAARLAACTGEESRAAALALILTAVRLRSFGDDNELTAVARNAVGYGPDETAVLVGLAALIPAASWETRWNAGVAALALNAVEQLPEAERAALIPGLENLRERLSAADGLTAAQRRKLSQRLAGLLPGTGEAAIPPGLLPAREPWAAPFQTLAAERPSTALADLLQLLPATSSTRPSAKWRRECVSLVEATDAAAALTESLRELAVEEPTGDHDPDSPGHHPEDGWGRHGFGYRVDAEHRDVACGIVWAAALTAAAQAIPDLLGLARLTGNFHDAAHWDPKLAGAAINALAAVDDPAGLEALRELDSRIRHKSLRKQIESAVETAAARQGITPRQLVERSAPDLGLDPDGTFTREIGGIRVTLAAENAVSVRLTFTTGDGEARRTAPAAIKDAPRLAEIKALAKRYRTALATERRRLESLLAVEAEWPHDEWARHYRDHPVVGVLARALIWEFRDEAGEWHAALPADAPETAAAVRLWHPIRHSPDEVRHWRGVIADRELRQPFKQAFREIYLLTPAEEATETYSNRFAAHIVHYNRFYALTKERGWQSNYLGRHESGYFGEARGTFGEGQWRATFEHVPATEHFDYSPDHASTDRVLFEQRAGKRWKAVSLAEVPPAVFSEAMRDVDLFVGVTSIAADPDWADHGDTTHAGYWRETAFGVLTATAETRRAALERIVPRLRIADRCTLTDRFLTVRGELRTYKIHLGSANILMEPDDAYLCIVHGKSGSRVFLPFEDERLSLILSKAALLAADTKIKDQTILTQIQRTSP